MTFTAERSSIDSLRILAPHFVVDSELGHGHIVAICTNRYDAERIAELLNTHGWCPVPDTLADL